MSDGRESTTSIVERLRDLEQSAPEVQSEMEVRRWRDQSLNALRAAGDVVDPYRSEFEDIEWDPPADSGFSASIQHRLSCINEARHILQAAIDASRLNRVEEPSSQIPKRKKLQALDELVNRVGTRSRNIVAIVSLLALIVGGAAWLISPWAGDDEQGVPNISGQTSSGVEATEQASDGSDNGPVAIRDGAADADQGVGTEVQLSPEDVPLWYQQSSAIGVGRRDDVCKVSCSTALAGEKPAFNIYDNTPEFGDEGDFLRIFVDADGEYSNLEMVQIGDRIELDAFIHNGAYGESNGADLDGPGVAHGSRVAFRTTLIEGGVILRAWIWSDNAGLVTDTVVFRSAQGLDIELVEVDARFEQAGTGPQPISVSDLFSRSGAFLPVVDNLGTAPAVDFDAWSPLWVTTTVEVVATGAETSEDPAAAVASPKPVVGYAEAIEHVAIESPGDVPRWNERSAMEGGGRYQRCETGCTPIANRVVFNTLVDTNWGEERDFLRIWDPASGDLINRVGVAVGDDVLLHAYLHNNGSSPGLEDNNGENLDGPTVAHDVEISVKSTPTPDGAIVRIWVRSSSSDDVVTDSVAVVAGKPVDVRISSDAVVRGPFGAQVMPYTFWTDDGMELPHLGEAGEVPSGFANAVRLNIPVAVTAVDP